MGNADSVSAVFGLLLGLVAHHPPVVATATAATSGPAVAIEKAQSAATAESRRARESDAEAARVFSPTSDGAPVASAAKSNAVTAATAAEASKATAPADASAATVPAEASDAVVPADASKTAASTAADAQLAANGSEDTYDPSRHRDPFRPPPSVVADKAVARTPLEAYEIGQLKLVGIVKDAGTVRAMVEDSAGLGYIVTTGTPIGLGGGVVRSIEQRRVLIQETTTTLYGEKQAKEVVMELPQEDRSP